MLMKKSDSYIISDVDEYDNLSFITLEEYKHLNKITSSYGIEYSTIVNEEDNVELWIKYEYEK